MPVFGVFTPIFSFLIVSESFCAAGVLSCVEMCSSFAVPISGVWGLEKWTVDYQLEDHSFVFGGLLTKLSYAI